MLWIKGLQLLCLPLDLILSFIESLILPKERAPELPVVFVVGIHRTGSTFVSQVLADSLGFAPLGNFATVFPRSSYLIHSLFKKFYHPQQDRSAKKYKSYYGISRGFFSIGDSYDVWDRWLGKDHYNRPGEISEGKKRKMVAYLGSLQKAWGRPVITKNNRNTLIIETLYQTVPNAFFVMVNRNPADVIQSTMHASREFFGTDEIIWGLREDNSFAKENYKDKLDAYCNQYLDLEDSILTSLGKIPTDDYLVVQYEGFCENPEQVQKELWAKLKHKYGLSDEFKGTGSSRYYTSRRLYDEAMTLEINQRIRAIRASQKDQVVASE